MQKTSFVVACSKAFRLQGEGLPDFSAQLKMLTEKDKEDLTAEFLKVGVEILPSAAN